MIPSTINKELIVVQTSENYLLHIVYAIYPYFSILEYKLYQIIYWIIII